MEQKNQKNIKKVTINLFLKKGKKTKITKLINNVFFGLKLKLKKLKSKKKKQKKNINSKRRIIKITFFEKVLKKIKNVIQIKKVTKWQKKLVYMPEKKSLKHTIKFLFSFGYKNKKSLNSKLLISEIFNTWKKNSKCWKERLKYLKEVKQLKVFLPNDKKKYKKKIFKKKYEI